MTKKELTQNSPLESGCVEECSPLADTELDRQFPRSEQRRDTFATIHPPQGASTAPVRCRVVVRDLSQGGFGIAHSEMLVARQQIELEVGTRSLVGEVQWCRSIQRGVFIAGCRIVDSKEAVER